MMEYPPCKHPYDGWFVDNVSLVDEGFLIADFIESSPPRRGTDLVVARATGQRYRQKFYDARTQTIVLWALKDDEFGNINGGAERNIDRLKRLFGGGLRQVELTRRVTLPFDRVSTRKAQVELVDALSGRREVLTQAGTYVQFAMDVRFADPFWYEPASVIEGADSSEPFLAWNPGTVASEKASLRIFGPAVNPTVTAEPAGTSFTLEREIQYGEFVDVDCFAFTAIDDAGVSVAGDLRREQVPLLQVFPGRNEITLSDGACTFKWEPAYL